MAVRITKPEINIREKLTELSASYTHDSAAVQGQIDSAATSYTLDFVTANGNTTTNDITIGTVTADELTVDTDTLHVDATNDRVGIGTSSPAVDLHVSSSSSTKATFERTGATGAYIGLKDGSGSFVYLGGNSGVFEVQTPGSSYSTKLAITSAGNVGIGNTSPAATLDVAGEAHADSDFFTDDVPMRARTFAMSMMYGV